MAKRSEAAEKPVNWEAQAGLPVDAANSLSLDGAIVQVGVGYYAVTFPSSTVVHVVLKETKGCRAHGEKCPAVQAVARYLTHGGQRAQTQAEADLIPKVCPVCGGKVRHEPRLLSKHRRSAWVCLTSAAEEEKVDTGLPRHLRILGSRHYWRAQIPGGYHAASS